MRKCENLQTMRILNSRIHRILWIMRKEVNLQKTINVNFLDLQTICTVVKKKSRVKIVDILKFDAINKNNSAVFYRKSSSISGTHLKAKNTSCKSYWNKSVSRHRIVSLRFILGISRNSIQLGTDSSTICTCAVFQ